MTIATMNPHGDHPLRTRLLQAKRAYTRLGAGERRSRLTNWQR